MNIQSIKFANSFKAEVAQAVQNMIDGEEEFRELDTLKSFIVSRSDSYNDNLFNGFLGKELGFKDIDNVFLFLKEK